METIRDLNKSFLPISLEEMDSVRLMDRVDSKFFFSSEQLPCILNGISDKYRLLEVNNVRLHSYESLYFDTPDFQLYTRHQNGLKNRYKFRFRRYVDSNRTCYFEIKFKNNKYRTIKKRTKVSEIPENISGKSEIFLKEKTPFLPNQLEPKLWVNYSRMTLVGIISPERITIDTNLHYIKTNGCEENPIHFPKIVIAEIKQSKTNHDSPFIRIIRENLIREGGMSKYCFGVYNLFEGVKKNRFKPMVQYIHKITS